MLTQSFQILIICLFCFAIILVVAFGMYSRYRYNAYIGTGRVSDIEIWYLRQNIAWAFTAGLSLVLIMKFI